MCTCIGFKFGNGIYRILNEKNTFKILCIHFNIPEFDRNCNCNCNYPSEDHLTFILKHERISAEPIIQGQLSGMSLIR